MTLRFHKDGWPQMASVFPDEATAGRVTVRHREVTVTDEEYARIRMAVAPGRSFRRPPKAGDKIAMLYIRGNSTEPRVVECATRGCGESLWMSDTPDERFDHWSPRHHARGEVLIGGLGLGMVALACALKPEVERVTVIERHPDVIALVAPHLDRALGPNAPKVTVITDDVFTWKPPKGVLYDMIWMDVWGDYNTDDLVEHTALFRKYARRKAPGGFMDCWKNGELRYRAGLRPRR